MIDDICQNCVDAINENYEEDYPLLIIVDEDLKINDEKREII